MQGVLLCLYACIYTSQKSSHLAKLKVAVFHIIKSCTNNKRPEKCNIIDFTPLRKMIVFCIMILDKKIYEKKQSFVDR